MKRLYKILLLTGYRYDALVHENQDSAMYIHPFKDVKSRDSPLIKYASLKNYDDQQFCGLKVWKEIGRVLICWIMSGRDRLRGDS